MDSRRSSGMFAKETTSRRPSPRSASGAILKPPPKIRALATISISISRRDGASPSRAIETGKPGNRCSWRSAQYA